MRFLETQLLVYLYRRMKPVQSRERLVEAIKFHIGTVSIMLVAGLLGQH